MTKPSAFYAIEVARGQRLLAVARFADISQRDAWVAVNLGRAPISHLSRIAKAHAQADGWQPTGAGEVLQVAA